MSNAGLIKIDPDALSGLEQKIRGLTEDVPKVAEVYLRGAPEVDHSYDDLTSRWDGQRKKLFEQLEQIADMLATIRDAFEKTDSDLTAALTEGQGTP